MPPPNAAPAAYRILVVDGSNDAQASTRAVLGKGDVAFTTTGASGAEDALVQLQTGLHDLCLVAHDLAPISGLELVRRAVAAGVRTPLVVIIGDDVTVGRECLAAGAADFVRREDLAAGHAPRLLRHLIELQRTRDQLRATEERYALAVEGSTDGIWDWDLVSNSVYFAAQWQATLGLPAEAQAGRPLHEWFGRIHPNDLPYVKQRIDAHLHYDAPRFEAEYRIRHSDGSYRWVRSRGLALRDASGKPVRMAGSLTDNTRSAHHDPLTELPSRALVIDRVEQLLFGGEDDLAMRFAILYMRVSNFQMISAGLGQEVADLYLKQIAARLRAAVRPGDTVGRVVGDEFVVLLADADIELAQQTARRIRQALAEPIPLRDERVVANACIGVVLGQEEDDDAEALLHMAASAMHRATGTSNKVVVYARNLQVTLARRLRLESDLRQAIARDQLHLHYQPIVSVKQNRIIGFEALLRWWHPQRGHVPPDEFISVAEEAGLIQDIGWWVVEHAIAQLTAWRRQGHDVAINVNVSAAQIANDDLPKQLADILRRHELEPAAFKLELTESMLMESDVSANYLSRLKSTGVGLWIDDFGTGYSSLEYLSSFPVNGLKIDKSFVSGHDGKAYNDRIVTAIARLAHSLGLQITAEGVETPEQLESLAALSCDFAQGYLISKPCTAEEASKLVKSGAWSRTA